MIWKSLSVLSASSSPIVVVLSGSMEPAFQRGDLLFLWNRAPRAEIGEIVVYNVVSFICLDSRRDVPIAIALTMIHQQRRSSLPGGESLEGRARTHVDGEKVGCASDIVDLALVEPREDLGRQIILDELGPVLRTNERSSAPGAARVAQYE